jgi:hypothetical protein
LHIGQSEFEYHFASIEQLLADFEHDIAIWSWTMKAIIEVARRGSAAHRARAKLASSRQGRAPDFA